MNRDSFAITNINAGGTEAIKLRHVALRVGSPEPISRGMFNLVIVNTASNSERPLPFSRRANNKMTTRFTVI